MRNTYALLLCTMILATPTFAQWPTSTSTSNALIINYGFEARVLTFDDGSSIFSHGITNSVYLTKLDPRGYRVWGQQPVVAHHNDSSDFGGGALIVSDNAGGAIVGWIDHRGATINPRTLDYYNNARYMQRVDASGAIRWRAGGVLVVPPITGRKGGDIVTDGAGGAIFATSEVGFGYPGAPNRERLVAARVNSNGEKLWEITLDSSLQANRIFFQGVVRAGRYIYINVMRYYTPTQETYLTVIIDTTGSLAQNPIWVGPRLNVSWRDSVLFTMTSNRVTKIAPSGDTLWSATVPLPQDSCHYLSRWKFILPEESGGFFHLRVCDDSVFHVNAAGRAERMRFAGLSSVALNPNTVGLFSDGHGGLVWADEGGMAQRYDSLGTPIWGVMPMVFRSDPQNSYFPEFWTDNNGGILATFWSTARGLCVQHTGRFGQPGIVPVAYAQEFPHTFQLDQNYPNPFNPTTRIQFSLPKGSTVSIKVNDILGREVATLVDEHMNQGDHVVTWDGSEQSGGVYFCRLIVSGDKGMLYTQTRKMLLLR